MSELLKGNVMPAEMRPARVPPMNLQPVNLQQVKLLGMMALHILLWLVAATPYALLAWLSLGSGWSYPNLGPDRFDLQPWRSFAGDRGELWRSMATSGLLGLSVATLSTLFGMSMGRHVQRQRGVWMFLAYLPFACSPVIISVCLLDLFIRLGLASTLFGVFLIQSLFASAFATILFSELWGADIVRMEQLVVTLGGSRWHAWRHAVWPRVWQLAAVCWLQMFLFSWLDYALVSTIGGGVVPSLTLRVIGYIREASINQAAQAAIVLILPPLASLMMIALVLQRRLLAKGNEL